MTKYEEAFKDLQECISKAIFPIEDSKISIRKKALADLEILKELVEKDAVKEPVKQTGTDYECYEDTHGHDETFYFCPVCGSDNFSGYFCGDCGQKLFSNDNK